MTSDNANKRHTTYNTHASVYALRSMHTQTHRTSIAITTDKALDPSYGWKIIDRIENVPNPEVLDSTGFIHILNK